MTIFSRGCFCYCCKNGRIELVCSCVCVSALSLTQYSRQNHTMHNSMSHIQVNCAAQSVPINVAVVFVAAIAATFINHMVQYQCFNILHCIYVLAGSLAPTSMLTISRMHTQIHISSTFECIAWNPLKRKHSMKWVFSYAETLERWNKRKNNKENLYYLSVVLQFTFCLHIFQCLYLHSLAYLFGAMLVR